MKWDSNFVDIVGSWSKKMEQEDGARLRKFGTRIFECRLIVILHERKMADT